MPSWLFGMLPKTNLVRVACLPVNPADVALHQAIKLDKSGKQLLALGQAGKPGAGPNAFCKPTQVAVGRDGSLYVSGGWVSSQLVWGRGAACWKQHTLEPQRGRAQPASAPHSPWTAAPPWLLNI